MSNSTCVKSEKLDEKLLYKLLTGIYPFDQNQFYIDGVKFQLKRRNNFDSFHTKNYLRITMLNGKKTDLNLHHIGYKQFVFFDLNHQFGLSPSVRAEDPCLFHIHIALNQFDDPCVRLQSFRLDSIQCLNVFEKIGSGV